MPNLMEGRVNKRQFTLDRGKELKKRPLYTEQNRHGRPQRFTDLLCYQEEMKNGTR
jgi:hypothetical protein